MSFSTTATFTTSTAKSRSPVPKLRYQCFLEQGPPKGALTLRVLDPNQDHKQVSSTILRCARSEVEQEVKAHLEALHTGKGYAAVLGQWEPRDEWRDFLR